MRKEGYYWVKYKSESGWHVAQWDTYMQAWYHIGNDHGDSSEEAFDIIGPKIIQPIDYSQVKEEFGPEQTIAENQ